MGYLPYILSFINAHNILIGNTHFHIGTSWSWSHSSWLYSYICLSQLTLWVRIPFSRGVLDTTLWCSLSVTLSGRWFSPNIPVSSTNKTDHHDISVILLEMALVTIIHPSECSYICENSWVQWLISYMYIYNAWRILTFVLIS